MLQAVYPHVLLQVLISQPHCYPQGSFMAVASPNFGGLFKRQQALEGTYRTLQVGRGNEGVRGRHACTPRHDCLVDCIHL